eukprot:gnl/TRDRNA2_/TRDRNA2_136050_c0_seq2.p1 gnl/TRDRNA2_/TRDRNA2_136050_c0~~gnl/TRDRNA2_/TRDRNA2_136050_c0_seq2.p1  ORF type:complete len:341 (+),score=83.40 gnl/TRDRNA2_/TRDRNA2_136050_c0_seq2:127-1023(+)
MAEAVEAAERKAQVAKTEVARVHKLVVTYRKEKADLFSIGQGGKMNEIVPLLERTEAELDAAKKIHADLEWQVKRARMKLRHLEDKLRRQNQPAEATGPKPEHVIFLRDLADVVTKDIGGKRHEDGRWPLVWDPTGKAATFFIYSGAAFFEAVQLAVLTASHEYEESLRLRLALLNHLKYGGELVINLGDDTAKGLQMVEDAFNAVEHGLFNALTDRAVLYSYLLPRRFLALVPPELEKEYDECMFLDEELSKFVLAFVSAEREPGPDVLQKACQTFYTIKVNDPDMAALELQAEDSD